MSLQKCTVIYDGQALVGPADIPLIDFLDASNRTLPHVCYHLALEPLQTCDVCWVEQAPITLLYNSWGFRVFSGKIE
ncbi:formate dehydrogenase major subunit [Kosakonia sacchari]|nr:formate dehydrogenase major subunit [Kosakonia sacchari]